MKQLFVVAFIAAMHSSVYAQTQKGQSITSGSVGLSYGNAQASNYVRQDELVTKTTSYGISLTLNRGTFFRDNWSINYSLSPTYSRRATNYDVPGVALFSQRYNTYQIGAGLALRRYWPLVEHLHVYVGGGISGAVYQEISEAIRSTSSDSERRTSQQWRWSIQPTGQAGLLYSLTDRLALEANAQTTGFPINVGTVGFGLALLTGNTSAATYPATESTAAPQLQKGRWLLGASAEIDGAGIQQEDDAQTTKNTNSSASASLLAGQFIRDKVLLGVEAAYTANRTGSQTFQGAPYYGLTLDAYVRSYLGGNRLRPFIQGGVRYGFNKVGDSDSKRNEAGLIARAGLAYLVGDRFIIQSTLGSLGATYEWYTGLQDGGSLTSVNLNAQATLTPGFAVYYAL